jgi:hypothetical protein
LNNTNVDSAFMALVSDIKLRLETTPSTPVIKKDNKPSKIHVVIPERGEEKKKPGCAC